MTDDVLAEVCGGCAIGRRDFVLRSAMLAAGAALAACGVTDSTGPQLNGSAQVNVNNYPALANVGGIAVMSVQGTPIAVVRTGSSSFLALSRVCPHQGGTITTSGSGFRCPEHGATFNASGTWTGGQHTSNMYSYQTSYNAQTGTLTIS